MAFVEDIRRAAFVEDTRLAFAEDIRAAFLVEAFQVERSREASSALDLADTLVAFAEADSTRPVVAAPLAVALGAVASAAVALQVAEGPPVVEFR